MIDLSYSGNPRCQTEAWKISHDKLARDRTHCQIRWDRLTNLVTLAKQAGDESHWIRAKGDAAQARNAWSMYKA